MKKKREVENLEAPLPFKANFSRRSDRVQLVDNQSPGLHLNHKTQRDQNIRDSGAFATWITSTSALRITPLLVSFGVTMFIPVIPRNLCQEELAF